MLDTANSEVVLRSHNGEPLIRKTPGVCGGDACIRDTRIMVWLLVAFEQSGMIDQDLLAAYPSLCLADLHAAREYYRLHPEEIDDAIRLNEEGNEE
jgi:uncharacterized protein (DUF433 family)